MRKLLIATDNFLPRHDGISRFLSEVLPVLQEMFEVTVVCPNFGEVNVSGITLVQLPLSKWRVGDYPIPKLCFSAVKKIVAQNDVVFVQGLGPVGYAALRASKKKKLVYFTHSLEWELVPRSLKNPVLSQILPDIIKLMVRKQLKKPDLLLVPSENISEMLWWNKIHTRREVLHLGVNSKEFVPVKDKKKAKEAIGLPPDALVIGYHGRLAREKDLPTLLRAFIRLQKGLLLIVGDGLPEIRKRFERKNVVLVPATSNVVPYLQAMDIYVLPSLTETTSLSVLEAMSCGLAVVSTPVGYIRDYIQDGENGVFIEKQNPYDLAKKLEPLIASQLAREKLGFAARKTVEKEFTWDKTRTRIKEIFTGL